MHTKSTGCKTNYLKSYFLLKEQENYTRQQNLPINVNHPMVDRAIRSALSTEGLVYIYDRKRRTLLSQEYADRFEIVQNDTGVYGKPKKIMEPWKFRDDR